MKSFVAAAVLMAASFAHAETDTFEFKGMALGADVAQFEKNRRFLCLKPKNASADLACGMRRADGETIAGIPVESLMLFFTEAKLQTIYITFASKEFDTVVAALQEKYGKVTPLTDEVQNRMGATFNNETYSWRKSDQVLKAEKYGSKITTSRVTFQTDAGFDEFARRLEAQKKANAKDL